MLGNLKITFNPFTVTLDEWYRPVSILLMCLALEVYSLGKRSEGYKKGLERGSEITIELIKNKMDGNKQDEKN